MLDDYSKIVSEAKYKTEYGEGLKILTPKQIIQRLPIGLAQVKAGNNIWKLTKWNQTNQVFPFCAKEITETLYNNVINSTIK